MARAGRVQFHPRKQVAFMFRQGQRVVYQKAYRCPCFDEDSLNKDIKCNLCDVDGYRYECSIPTVAIITGVQDKMNFNQVGTIKQGDCIGGFHWNFPIAFHDKVTLINKKTREEAMLVMDEFEPPMLKNYEVCQLDELRTMDDVLIPYVDWNLDTDGRTIVFLNPDKTPAEGAKFTVQFWIRPVYLVWQTLPLERYSEDKDMLKHVILRRKDDFGGLGRDYAGGN